MLHGQRAMIRAGWLGLPAVLVLGLCGCQSRPYEYRCLAFDICHGLGAQRRCPWGPDRFTEYLRGLEDRDEDVRLSVRVNLNAFTLLSGEKYIYVMDAYLDADRAPELIDGLREAWTRGKRGTGERWDLAELFAQAKARACVWADANVAKEIGISRERPPYRGYGGFSVKTLRLVVERLIAEGDAELQEAWRDYHEHLALFRGEPSRTDR